MAGRFVSQKLTSPMSRSRSLLGAHASAAASAGAQATRASEGSIRTLSNISNGAALNLGTKVVNSPIHGYEAGVGTLGNLFHGAAGHPRMVFPANHGIHGYTARYFNTMPCSRAAPKTCWPALVDSARVRRSFSFKISWDAEPEARMAAYIAEREAERAAWKAEEEVKRAAWQAKATDRLAKLKLETNGFRNYMSLLGLVWTFNFLCWFSPALKQEDTTPAP